MGTPKYVVRESLPRRNSIVEVQDIGDVTIELVKPIELLIDGKTSTHYDAVFDDIGYFVCAPTPREAVEEMCAYILEQYTALVSIPPDMLGHSQQRQFKILNKYLTRKEL